MMHSDPTKEGNKYGIDPVVYNNTCEYLYAKSLWMTHLLNEKFKLDSDIGKNKTVRINIKLLDFLTDKHLITLNYQSKNLFEYTLVVKKFIHSDLYKQYVTLEDEEENRRLSVIIGIGSGIYSEEFDVTIHPFKHDSKEKNIHKVSSLYNILKDKSIPVYLKHRFKMAVKLELMERKDESERFKKVESINIDYFPTDLTVERNHYKKDSKLRIWFKHYEYFNTIDVNLLDDYYTSLLEKKINKNIH